MNFIHNGKHSDVEYHVEILGNTKIEVYSTLIEARFALGNKVGKVDVCIWSEEGAHSYGGDWAVAQYREDPDASVFERYERLPGRMLECIGMIP